MQQDPSGVRLEYEPPTAAVRRMEQQSADAEPSTKKKLHEEDEDSAFSSSRINLDDSLYATPPTNTSTITSSSAPPTSRGRRPTISAKDVKNPVPPEFVHGKAQLGLPSGNNGPSFKDQVHGDRHAVVTKQRSGRSKQQRRNKNNANAPVDVDAFIRSTSSSANNSNNSNSTLTPPVSSNIGPAFKDQARAVSRPNERPGGQAVSKRTTNTTVDDVDGAEDEVSASSNGGGGDGGMPILINAHLVDDESRIDNCDIYSADAVALKGGVFLQRRTLIVLAVVLLAAAAIIGGFCGATGQCSRRDDDNNNNNNNNNGLNVRETGNSTGFDNGVGEDEDIGTDETQFLIAEYINNVTLISSEKTILYPVAVTEASPEEASLRWLIEDDPLDYSVDLRYKNQTVLFRLRQRHALLSLLLQRDTVTNNKTANTSPETLLLSNDVTSTILDECSWFGVTCTLVDVGPEIGFQKAVTAIDLGGSGLNGRIPNDIALLEHTARLDLSANPNLTSFLPSTIELLRNLRVLKVSSCNVTGSLPASIGALSLLEILDVSNNAFAGSPASVMNRLASLVEFNISLNGFTGPLPVGEWFNLESFSASQLSLTGVLPESIGSWTSLKQFEVFSTSLSGTLPSSIAMWKDLEYFDICCCLLSGTLPEGIGQWSNLERFRIDAVPAENLISLTDPFPLGFNGTLPMSIGNWRSVKEVHMYGNSLTGTLPSGIESWQNLTQFLIGGNSFTGSLPEDIGSWTNIENFSVDVDIGSLLSRILRSEFGLEISRVAELRQNQLSGTLPSSIAEWPSIIEFSIFNNDFSGTLPRLERWTNLRSLGLSQNNFRGRLPDANNLWPDIVFAHVHSNDFTGSIPESVGNWSQLVQALFHDNSFTGSVPVGICNASFPDPFANDPDLAAVFSEVEITADCLFAVECSCCTDCY